MDEKDQDMLFDAVKGNNYSKVNTILGRAKLGKGDHEKVLMRAVDSEAQKLIKLMIDGKVLEKQAVKDTLPKLYPNSEAGTECIIQLLDFLGEDADQKLMETLFTSYVWRGNLKLIRYAGEKVKNKSVLNRALFSAIRARRPSAVGALIYILEADVNTRGGFNDSTPIIDAARGISSSMTSAAKVPQSDRKGAVIERPTYDSIDIYARIIDMLLDRGADVRLKDSEGKTVFDFIPERSSNKRLTLLQKALEEAVAKSRPAGKNKPGKR